MASDSDLPSPHSVLLPMAIASLIRLTPSHACAMQAISAAVITAEAAQDAPAASWALAAQPVHLAEPVQGGELSSSVQKRRSMRRLRWQQAATAAAVAGAIAGVSSGLDRVRRT